MCRANECGVFAIDGAEDDQPIGRHFTLDDLWMHCMARRDVSFLGDNWPESTWDAGEWLDVLFPGGEWICLARADLATAQTRRRQSRLILPSRCSATKITSASTKPTA